MSESESALGVMESAEVESPVIDTAVESPELDGQQPTGDEHVGEKEGEQRPTKTDGRLLPKDVQRILKDLRETNPQAARQLNDSYFREQRYSQLGKIEEIEGLKSKYEELGGDEGVSTLRASHDLLEKLDKDYAEGNPAVLDDIPAEGFKKLVSPALERLERLDPENYASTLRPHLVRAIEGSGLPDVLEKIDYLLRRNDPEEAMKHLTSARKWLVDARAAVDESKRSSNDPKLADLSRREQAIKVQETNQFKSQVGGEVVGKINSTIKGIIETEEYKSLTDKQRSFFAKTVYRDVEEILSGDKDYREKVDAAISSRDGKRLTAYINSKIGPIVTRAAREAKGTLFSNVGTPKPAATSTQTKKPAQNQTPTIGARPLMLPGKPDNKDIDWAKSGDRTLALIRHKVVLKNGKSATWK